MIVDPRGQPIGGRRRSFFGRFAKWIARAAGYPATFFGACTIIVVWALTGPIFGFSDTWQLVINTSTTIVTFLMVFLIQSTQNRDSEAMHLKLDEIVRALSAAHNVLIDLEDLEQEDLDRIKAKYAALAEEARALRRRGGADTGRRVEVDLDVDVEVPPGAGAS